jgi:hypothetical protein
MSSVFGERLPDVIMMINKVSHNRDHLEQWQFSAREAELLPILRCS